MSVTEKSINKRRYLSSDSATSEVKSFTTNDSKRDSLGFIVGVILILLGIYLVISAPITAYKAERDISSGGLLFLFLVGTYLIPYGIHRIKSYKVVREGYSVNIETDTFTYPAIADISTSGSSLIPLNWKANEMRMFVKISEIRQIDTEDTTIKKEIKQSTGTKKKVYTYYDMKIIGNFGKIILRFHEKGVREEIASALSVINKTGLSNK